MIGFARDHLATLLVLVDEGTFDRAAKRLHVTASAVSQRIRAMEQTAGQILVERTNPVLPTAAGDIVLRLARQVQLVENDALTELGQTGSRAGRAAVSVAVNSDSLATWFLSALATASEKLDVVFDVHADDQEYTAGLLRSGTVMAAVTSIPEPVQGCSAAPLGTMRYLAVASSAFVARWGGAGILSSPSAPLLPSSPQSPAPDSGLSWLQDAPLVDFDRKDGLQRDFLARKGMDARQSPRNVVPTSADFARAVVLGLGWGMLPEQQCLDDVARGALISLAPGDPTDVPLYWQRWNLDSRLLDSLTSAVREAAAEALHPAQAGRPAAGG